MYSFGISFQTLISHDGFQRKEMERERASERDIAERARLIDSLTGRNACRE